MVTDMSRKTTMNSGRRHSSRTKTEYLGPLVQAYYLSFIFINRAHDALTWRSADYKVRTSQ